MDAMVRCTLVHSARALWQWEMVHWRFSRWCRNGGWERVLETLNADRDNQYLMIDSTIAGTCQQAAGG